MGSGRSFAMTIAGVAAYGLAIRPWFMHWGATDSEVERDLPGDDLTSNSAWQATRGITIHAPVETVWTSLMQAGRDQDECCIRSWRPRPAERADHRESGPPEPPHEARKVGDSVWLIHPERWCSAARYVVAILDPGRAMVLVSPAKAERLTTGDPGGEGSRAFVVEPIDGNSTRLIVRSRAGENLGIAGWLCAFLIVDPGQFLMERRMMLGIKAQAEKSTRYGRG